MNYSEQVRQDLLAQLQNKKLQNKSFGNIIIKRLVIMMKIKQVAGTSGVSTNAN